jgi:hypothetical protein
MARHHGSRRLARKYASSYTCPTCLTKFGSRSRIIDHLAEKSAVCFLSASIHMPPITDALLLALDQATTLFEQANRAARRRHTYSHTRARQCEGPLWQLYIPPGYALTTRKIILLRPLRTAITWHDDWQPPTQPGIQQHSADIQADMDSDDLPPPDIPPDPPPPPSPGDHPRVLPTIPELSTLPSPPPPPTSPNTPPHRFLPRCCHCYQPHRLPPATTPLPNRSLLPRHFPTTPSPRPPTTFLSSLFPSSSFSVCHPPLPTAS